MINALDYSTLVRLMVSIRIITLLYIIIYYNNFDSCLGNEMSFSESSSQFPKPRPQFVGTHAPPVHGFMSLNRTVPTEIWLEILYRY